MLCVNEPLLIKGTECHCHLPIVRGKKVSTFYMCEIKCDYLVERAKVAKLCVGQSSKISAAVAIGIVVAYDKRGLTILSSHRQYVLEQDNR